MESRCRLGGHVELSHACGVGAQGKVWQLKSAVAEQKEKEKEGPCFV